jgi:hypothetical protein
MRFIYQNHPILAFVMRAGRCHWTRLIKNWKELARLGMTKSMP